MTNLTHQHSSIGRLAVALGICVAAAPLSSAERPTTEAPRAIVRLDITLMNDFEGAPRGAFRFEALGAELAPVDVAVETVEDSVIAVAALPPQSAWRVRAGISKGWAADLTVKTGKAGTTTAIPVRLWPSGMISGRFLPPNQVEDLPAALSLELSPAVDAGGLRKALGRASACPIQDDGQWRCRIPAGRFDVVVRPADFVPLYRWDLEVGRANEVKLGTIRLKKGASIKGFVETATGLALPPRVRVRAEPLAAPGGPTASERLVKAAPEATADHRGFFQLAGIRPGAYRLVVEAEGFATASVFPLEIYQGVESALGEPIVLELPMNIDLRVTPAVAPDGRPWLIRATRASDYSASYNHQAAFEGPTDQAGQAMMLDQTPGRYMIGVSDHAGNAWKTLWEQPIEGVGDILVEIAVDFVAVEGHVSIGDEPVVGRVFFGGHYGAQKADLASDEEGYFAGLIPRDGIWRVVVESADGTLAAKTTIEVVADREGLAKVDIELPDTHIYGVVVDTEGRAVEHARVTISSRDGGDGTETDREGQFSFRGHVGRVALSAKHGEQVAKASVLNLVDAAELGPVTLRLGAMRSLTGSVVGPNGPIAGALVQAATLVPARTTGGEARTGLNGAFELSLPQSATTLAVLVAAPGHALEAFVMDARGESLDIVVSPNGGSVILRVEVEPMLYGLALLFQDNILLRYQTLFMWALGNGGTVSPDGATIEAPNLAPGLYRYCLGQNTLLDDPNAWRAASTCTSGTLSPGGTLELVLATDRAETPAP